MALASTTHMSLVEVSPSTVTRLKVRGTISWRASESISWVMAQSVVMKHSMVPMLGWIMPEPLAMAPRVTVLPPMEQVTASSFFTVSVVMMALAAASEPSLDRAAAAWGRPFPMASMFSSWPMTPVEATTKSSGLQAGGLGGQDAHLLGVLVAVGGAGVGVAGVGHDGLGLPVLQVVHGHIDGGGLHPVHGVHRRRGAGLLRHDEGQVLLARQHLGHACSWAGWLPSPLPFFTPQWTPEAVKPLGAVTPPEICFISFTPSPSGGTGRSASVALPPPLSLTAPGPVSLQSPASGSCSAPPRRRRPCPGCRTGR